jgi:hypothetical protein
MLQSTILDEREYTRALKVEEEVFPSWWEAKRISRSYIGVILQQLFTKRLVVVDPGDLIGLVSVLRYGCLEVTHLIKVLDQHSLLFFAQREQQFHNALAEFTWVRVERTVVGLAFPARLKTE